MMLSKDEITNALRTVYDPEFTIDIVSLNMVKRIQIQDASVDIDLVLTTPSCPMAPFIKLKIEQAIMKAIPHVSEVKTRILNERWEPPAFLGPMEIIYPDFVTVQEAPAR